MSDLIACAGSWTGTYLLRLNPDDPGVTSETTVHVAPVLKERFVRLDQTWVWEGQQQEGTILVAHDPQASTVEMHWADTWHNGHAIMVLRGGPDLDATGSYPAPSGPDWGWRIRIGATPDRLSIEMWNITPDGLQVPAVDADLSPS
ncbi:MAG TPA: DUF1579 family protein [Actinomycetota bacterium]|nr:DUF1579 family protein [Actinomycetota bacterium]